MVLSRIDHLVAVPPRRQRLGQQVVDVGPDLGDLGWREDVDGEQMTHLVVPANLGGREHLRLLDTRRDEPQITIQIREGVGVMSHVRNPTAESACKLADCAKCVIRLRTAPLGYLRNGLLNLFHLVQALVPLFGRHSIQIIQEHLYLQLVTKAPEST